MSDTNIGTSGETDDAISNNQSGNSGVTDDSTSNPNDQAGKTFTQKQVDDMMADAKRNITFQATKKYNDLGDFATLKGLVENADAATQQSLIDKGKFDDALAHVVETKDATIASQAKELRALKINDPLLKAAADHHLINPEQALRLLKQNVNLTPEGQIEVVDDNGKVRLGDDGKSISVNDLVKEFKEANPHFQQPGKSTVNSNSSHNSSTTEVLDFSKLDFSKSEDRAKYAKATGQLKT